ALPRRGGARRRAGTTRRLVSQAWRTDEAEPQRRPLVVVPSDSGRLVQGEVATTGERRELPALPILAMRGWDRRHAYYTVLKDTVLGCIHQRWRLGLYHRVPQRRGRSRAALAAGSCGCTTGAGYQEPNQGGASVEVAYKPC